MKTDNIVVRIQHAKKMQLEEKAKKEGVILSKHILELLDANEQGTLDTVINNLIQTTKLLGQSVNLKKKNLAPDREYDMIYLLNLSEGLLKIARDGAGIKTEPLTLQKRIETKLIKRIR